MSATPKTEQDAEKARALAKPIYEIINRLCQPPTGDEFRHIRELIAQGADLEVRYNDGNQETLLEIALCREYTEAALFLIREGADVNARCVQGITPFIFAAMKGNLEVLRAMYDIGNAPHPDRDFYDGVGEGKTALMVAAERDHKDCVTFLISKGADMHFGNNVGKSAADYARANNFPALVDTMEQATHVVAGQKIGESLLEGAREPVGVMKRLRLKTSRTNTGQG